MSHNSLYAIVFAHSTLASQAQTFFAKWKDSNARCLALYLKLLPVFARQLVFLAVHGEHFKIPKTG